MHHIHRSLSKSSPLNNRVILLGSDAAFNDSCSGYSDGFTIVAAEMMEEIGDRGAVSLISEFDKNDSISLSL